MGVLLNAQGTPEPPSEIVARLGRISPSLGLRLTPGSWAITWEWPLNDRRWARVQSQEIKKDSAFDIIGYLPLGCSLDQAAAYVENHLKNYPIEEIRKLRSKMHVWNTVELPKQQVEEVAKEALDQLASEKRQQNPRRTRIG